MSQELFHFARIRSVQVRVCTAVAVLFAALLTAAPPSPAQASPAQAAAGKYKVNDTGNDPDDNPGNNKCATAGNVCTLRAAIEEANAHPGKDTVTFVGPTSAAPWVIAVTGSSLPAITGPVVIDALSGTGASCKASRFNVTLDGDLAPGGSSGLTVLSGGSGSTIKGLVITFFPADGIQIFEANKVVVQCNMIGLQRDGLTVSGNSQAGVQINGNGAKADQNVIGGSAANRNIISGNGYGVFITNNVDTTAKGNKIQGNYIGTDFKGQEARGNGTGVYVQNAPKTLIGGSTKLGNVISGNTGDGVSLWTGANKTIIQGNLIGLSKNGLVDLGNGSYGIFASDSANLTVGGKSPTYTNVISGSNAYGLYLTGSVTGSNNAKIQGNLVGLNKPGGLEIPNGNGGVYLDKSSNSMIGGTTAAYRNVISGNAGSGITIFGTSTNNVVAGNFIGTDKNGYVSIPNGFNGITIEDASLNTVGGSESGARNVISGNGSTGVQVTNSAAGNTISGNYIGINVSSSAALGNSGNGITLNGCTGCLIGGSSSAGQRNVISGNNSNGIQISGGSGNQVFGNYIGTNSAGTAALPNNNTGVGSSSANNTQIGSAASALARNVISGNLGDGIGLFNDTGDTIQGNYIGLKASGNGALGNGTYGVSLYDSGSNTIGGVGAAARNVIGNSRFAGLYLYGAGSTGNVMQGNYIGLNAAGTAAAPNGVINGNNGNAVYFYQASNNTFGGVNPGEGNVVSGNSGNGIYVATSASGNVFQGNIIGLDPTGTKDLGNTNYGMYVYQATNTIIGGNAAGAGNVISGNGGSGIQLAQNSNDTIIKGNKIGTNKAGTAAIGNAGEGVTAYSVNNMTVGGPGAGDGNVISGNGSSGVSPGFSVTGAILIQGNAIGTDGTHGLALGNGNQGINSSAASTISNNVIAYNRYGGITQYGVPLGAGSNTNCLFYNLYAVGLMYSHTAANTFTGNWWGDAAGPGVDTTFDYTQPGRQNVYDSSSGNTDASGYLITPPAGIGCPSGTELILSNQDMEDDNNPADGIPDDWTPTGVMVSSGEGRRSDDEYDGLYSLKMVGGGTTKVSRTVTAAGSNNGHSIILGFYTRGFGVSGSGVYQASVKIGSKTFSFDVPVNSSGSTGGWEHHVLNFKAPANFTSAVVTLTYSKPYGSVWWDDISLYDVSVTP